MVPNLCTNDREGRREKILYRCEGWAGRAGEHCRWIHYSRCYGNWTNRVSRSRALPWCWVTGSGFDWPSRNNPNGNLYFLIHLLSFKLPSKRIKEKWRWIFRITTTNVQQWQRADCLRKLIFSIWQSVSFGEHIGFRPDGRSPESNSFVKRKLIAKCYSRPAMVGRMKSCWSCRPSLISEELQRPIYN